MYPLYPATSLLSTLPPRLLAARCVAPLPCTPPHRQHFSVQPPPPPLKMPNIKIYYFDFHFWRAEVSRMALYLGNVSLYLINMYCG